MSIESTRQYTTEFRAEMVRRMTGPGSVPGRSLARETGVAQATLSAWLRDARSLPMMTTAKSRTPEEKMRLVLLADGLEGEALGVFLRRECVHELELRDWRAAMLTGLSSGRPPPKSSSQTARIRKLERELRWKDKALAEAAALVILKKKARDFGLLLPEDDDTNEGNGSSS